jgi:hypothetical protein
VCPFRFLDAAAMMPGGRRYLTLRQVETRLKPDKPRTRAFARRWTIGPALWLFSLWIVRGN